MNTILILAGEPSGEKHAASLVHYLKSQKTELYFYGMGGDLMAKEGVELLYHVNQTSIMGFTEVIKHLPFIKEMKKTLVHSLDERKPDAVVLVDYPGFNLRFAVEAKKRNIPVYYYISPQIWAWGKGRIKDIQKLISHMLVILPFEKDIYDKAGVKCTYVGHPLLEQLKFNRNKQEFFDQYKLEKSKPLVALLPGSRNQEVLSLLPEMIAAVMPLIKQNKIQAIIGGVENVDHSLYQIAKKNNIGVIFNDAHHLMKHSDQAVVASGTATLETALCGTPLTVVYKTSAITYLLGRYIVKLDRISLVNIISNEMIVPELIQKDANTEKIRDSILNYLNHPDLVEKTKQKLSKLQSQLGEFSASERAGNVILREMVNGE